ncbi:MAG: hypothetical protein AW12_01587 [Candidatus Accumulibacter sp. BA-94]|nr:MAG: hypothetical protein AW12_01587 [Candidatus Accumulibacter sp. BA-94]
MAMICRTEIQKAVEARSGITGLFCQSSSSGGEPLPGWADARP